MRKGESLSIQSTTKVLVPGEEVNHSPDQAKERVMVAVRRHEYLNGLPLGITMRRKFYSLLPEEIRQKGTFPIQSRETKETVEIPILWAEQVLHFGQDTISLEEALKRKHKSENGFLRRVYAFIMRRDW